MPQPNRIVIALPSEAHIQKLTRVGSDTEIEAGGYTENGYELITLRVNGIQPDALIARLLELLRDGNEQD